MIITIFIKHYKIFIITGSSLTIKTAKTLIKRKICTIFT